MCEDVKVHLQEILDIGAIQKLYSPWASAIVLVWKKGWELEVLYQPQEIEQLDHQGHLLTTTNWWDCQQLAELTVALPAQPEV